ncbi:uncharacterized protein LOC123037287 [Drosophila rhopaloa]|uniref:Endonuclease n=2 Tax=Drosophila rhopaloa TaxID=1041015 RepID=A0ABM5J393_DRORH|nr:uncharacterized protein LOC123037287 [Drosophila rhopaloa]
MSSDEGSTVADHNIMTAETKVRFLKCKAESVYNSLKRMDISLAKDAICLFGSAELTVRLELLEHTQASFRLAHNALEELDYSEIGSELSDNFEMLMVSVKSRLRRQLDNCQLRMPTSSTMHLDPNLDQSTVMVDRGHRIRLPEVKLPTFSSGYTEYSDFLSMFISVIDKDPYLADIEKLQHLRSCLAGAALESAHINEILGLKRLESASAVALRDFSDKIIGHMRALQALGDLKQISGCMVVYMIVQKLDAATQANWEESLSTDMIPSEEDLLSYLEGRCQKLESVQHALASNMAHDHSAPRPARRTLLGAQVSQSSCVFCDTPGHGIYSCSSFSGLSPSLRQREIKRLSLCFNCLKKGHHTRTCNSGHCRTCGGKHHTLLHLRPDDSPPSQPSASLAAQGFHSDVVLLATAIVLVKNRAGSPVPCRVLLDSGSQLHLITSRFAQELQLRKSRSAATVTGLGDTAVSSEGSTVSISLQSRSSEYSVALTALVVPTITDSQPSYIIDIADWNMPSNIQLADPAFNCPQRVDLLLGAGLFYDLLCVGQIKLVHGLPLLQKTRLGWIVTGGGDRLRGNTSLLASQGLENGATLHNVRLEDLVRRFWEVENLDSGVIMASKEELECEGHFIKNFHRLPSGAYSVRLPLKHHAKALGDSYTQAHRRFLNLERKLQRNPHLKRQYVAFIKEYLELNHMSRVSPEAVGLCKYFLPHHCVLKEDSTTTKLRVVFDGSALASSGSSLNDVLMAGPVIQPRLFNILIKFRTYQVALTGDICKMYRCVRVSEPDNYLQCILWRDEPDKELEVYKLDTVTYGTKPASFLSVRAMHQLAIDERDSFPAGSVALQQDFYVDDFISGGSSVAEAIEKMRQTTEILARGDFKLRKWCTSHHEVLKDVSDDDKEKYLKFDDGSDITKTLGLAWDPATDELLFSLSSLDPGSKACRRSVLATVARFYDPLGLLGPVITKAKVFLQQLCKDKLDWDESLPLDRNTCWIEMCISFQSVQRISFPRFLLLSETDVEIHGFCDASEEAYGACIYVLSRGTSPASSHLLCSKSRVAPLKTISVPKLELCGALLLAKLMNEVMKMDMFNGPFHCWCDSSVALSWIGNEPFKFNVFVANRVASIQELTTNMEWHHIPTTLNPADILSRGSTPDLLALSEIWFHGPPFLLGGRKDWPTRLHYGDPSLELRKQVLMVKSPHVDVTLRSKYGNSFPSMQRVFAYIYKFSHRLWHRGLEISDVQRGTYMLWRGVQLAHLWEDIKELRSNSIVKKSSSIASLLPFIDACGLLRVGGRLENSTLAYEARHPIIVPRRHPLTLALIMHFHKMNLHAGPRALLASIRLQYWPIGGLRTVSNVLKGCVECFRARPKFLEPIMANLPKERLECVRAFAVSGVDYCGPFLYKSEVRTRSPIKCYVCVFICFTSKAVHLELVKDLTTASFLSALKRFISTRGKPSQIWSDNATNFVGAKNELADLKRLLLSDSHMQSVHQACLAEGIDWQFIPPRSPHFGGLWEAAVKTAKHHFYRSVGRQTLSFDELRTLVCQIASIINSRPLLSVSENPDDLDVLTPAHLLFGGPSTTIIEPDLTKLNYNRLDGWQRVTYLQQLFWSRWQKEYLTLLQQRTKWRSPERMLKVNDVVLIKDENLPPMRWPLARVTALIPGRDGVCRVADLKTSTCDIRRAVNKLCLLPTNDEVERQASNGGVC